MASCEYSRNGNDWYRPNGIDVLIWCMEGAVDTTLLDTGLYFYDRQAQPDYVRSDVTGYNSDGVRGLWLTDLYLYGPDTTQPPPPPEDCDPFTNPLPCP